MFDGNRSVAIVLPLKSSNDEIFKPGFAIAKSEIPPATLAMFFILPVFIWEIPA